jgi:hypothetical protein
MPIVINEFEIVPEPPQPREAGATSEAPGREEKPTVPEPWEILRVERVHLARLERVRAD